MSEEEIIEKYHHFKIKTADGIELDLIETKYYKELLDLYKQTKKELNSLKEIEKSHKEENGKLRVELEKYKLLEANIDKANKIIAENKFDEGLYGLLMQEKEKNKELEKDNKNLNILLDAKYKDVTYMLLNYISKDRIREIVIPTPDNPIPLEIQQSEFYAKILKVLEEK